MPATEYIAVPGPGVYLNVIHGLPESRDLKEWESKHRRAKTAIKKAVAAKKRDLVVYLHIDSSYFDCCVRYLKVKSKGLALNAYHHLTHEMRYPRNK